MARSVAYDDSPLYILLTDETNRCPSEDARFFIYGGLIFPVEHLATLHSKIEYIRLKAGYRAGDILKFDTHSRPQQVTFENATETKRQVIDCCVKLDCKFIAHIILHDIIKHQDADHQVRWAADYVISRFNKFLEEVDGDGICVVDNLPNAAEYRYLTEKFSHGLRLPGGDTIRLKRIKLFASTRIGASHANSAMDIVLGSFRYCVNNPENPDAAREMFSGVARMMWHRREGNLINVSELGLIVRPPVEKVLVPSYRSEYEELMRNLGDLLGETDRE